jgi:hypothetical protein
MEISSGSNHTKVFTPHSSLKTIVGPTNKEFPKTIFSPKSPIAYKILTRILLNLKWNLIASTFSRTLTSMKPLEVSLVNCVRLGGFIKK